MEGPNAGKMKRRDLKPLWVRGGSLVVRMLALHSDDPSLTSAEVYNLYVKNALIKGRK